MEPNIMFDGEAAEITLHDLEGMPIRDDMGQVHLRTEVPSFAARSHTPNKRIFTPVSSFLISGDREPHKADTGNPADYLVKTNTIECLQAFLLRHANGYKGKDLGDVSVRDLFPNDPFEAGDETGATDPDLRQYAYSVKQALEFKFVPQDVVENRQLKRALNVPFITALNHYVKQWNANTRVLIVGAHDGADFYRIRKALDKFGRNGTRVHIDTVEPNPEHRRLLQAQRSDFPGQDFCMKVQDLATLTYQYDFVLMHYSLHHVCRSTAEILSFAEALFRVLKPTGRVIGSHMDPGGAQLLGEPDANSHSSSVRVLNRRLPDEVNEWGAVEISVGGHIWIDPIINMSVLAAILGTLGLFFDAIPGRECHTHLRLGVTKTMSDWYREADLRSVLYFEITAAPMAKPVAVLTRKGSEVRFSLVGPPPLGLHLQPLNKGMAVSTADVPFLRCCNYFVSEKLDGVPGMIYATEGSPEYALITPSVNGPMLWKYTADAPSPIDFTAQVELCTPVGPPDITRPYFDATAILTDPVKFGLTPHQAFFARYSQACRYLAYHPELLWLGVKEWHPMSQAKVAELWQNIDFLGFPCDGLVFQEQMARPGLYNGVGTCRYLKTKYTIDLKFENGVVSTAGEFQGLSVGNNPVPDGVHEITLKRTPMDKSVRALVLDRVLRARPDKWDGNLQMQVDGLRRAFYYEDLQHVFELRSWHWRQFNFKRLAPHICSIYAKGGEISGSDHPHEVMSDLRMLGLTYPARLVFPTDSAGVQLLSPSQRVSLLWLRYDAYVQLWGQPSYSVEMDGEIGRLNAAIIP